jgi:glycosyltransferase involved in cell wall biosynthesis
MNLNDGAALLTRARRPVNARPAPRGLTVAVAMATFNGEPFLPEQLASLARQTKLPDELIVRDDGSTDGTVEIVETFARTAPFLVRIVRGDAHLGYARSFLETARLCRADLVAFCDQDDIWAPHKLARCVAEFERRPDVVLVVHSARAFGRLEPGTPRCYPGYRRRRIASPARGPLNLMVPGLALVASKRVLTAWDVISTPANWAHDDWTTFTAGALGSIVFLPDRLVLHRQHASNAVGPPRLSLSGRMDRSAAARGTESSLYRGNAASAHERSRLLYELDHRVDEVDGVVVRDGPRARAALWARLAAANERRAPLYSSTESPARGLRALAAHTLKGDYRARELGGLGMTSFGRDAIHGLGLLDLVLRVTRRTTRRSSGRRRRG